MEQRGEGGWGTHEELQWVLEEATKHLSSCRKKVLPGKCHQVDFRTSPGRPSPPPPPLWPGGEAGPFSAQAGHCCHSGLRQLSCAGVSGLTRSTSPVQAESGATDGLLWSWRGPWEEAQVLPTRLSSLHVWTALSLWETGFPPFSSHSIAMS